MTTTKIGKADWRAVNGDVLALDLGAASLIGIRGPDARRFCNGMFTNNIRALPTGGINRSAIVDDRARIGGFLSLMCVDEQHFLALLDSGIDISAFTERYERYIVFDDVTFEVPEPRRIVSLQGPTAAAALASLGWPVPQPGRFAHNPANQGIVLPQCRSAAGGYDLLLDEVTFQAVVASAVRMASAEVAEVIRIIAGRPHFPVDTGDKRLPHELALRDELLSFDKGCYIGQETINRVDVMGQVKRVLSGVRVVGGETLSAGAAVKVEGQEVGFITSVAITPDGDAVGLAVLKIPANEPGTALVLTLGEQRWEGTSVTLPLQP